MGIYSQAGSRWDLRGPLLSPTPAGASALPMRAWLHDCWGSRRRSSYERHAAAATAATPTHRLIHVNDIPANKGLKGNKIHTTKYNILTFIPRNLFEQFHRLAYIYFLVLSVVDQIPLFAVFGRGLSIVPLSAVLIVTAIKDAAEDWRRSQSDKRVNNSVCSVLADTDEYRRLRWRDLQPGHQVRLVCNDQVPADLLVLATSNPDGSCFVETANLDGESALKVRRAVGVAKAGGEAVHAVIECEHPTRSIYEFSGHMTLSNANVDAPIPKVPISMSNLLLRGCAVRNTQWVVGVVIYGGHETKALLNNTGAKSKRSKLERQMNREMLWLVAILLAMCLTGTIGTAAFYAGGENDKLAYLGPTYKYKGVAGEALLDLTALIILLQIMVPIALYISMEVVRIGQAWLMQRDRAMYDPEGNTHMRARALNINEDLGQIEYVFSDKTGTITQNKMVFRACSINGTCYGAAELGIDDVNGLSPGLSPPSSPSNGVDWNPVSTTTTDAHLKDALAYGNATITDFFLVLALCNTVMPTIDERKSAPDSIPVYQSESPDEAALVSAAAAYGFVLVERTAEEIAVSVQGEVKRFAILGIHEFDNMRRMMSVVVKFPDGSVRLLAKGADVAVLEQLKSATPGNVSLLAGMRLHIDCTLINSQHLCVSQDVPLHTTCLLQRTFASAARDEWWLDAAYEGQQHATLLRDALTATTSAHLSLFASTGLRTLAVAQKMLNVQVYNTWLQSYHEASIAIDKREEKKRVVAKSVENDLELLGATAIEDKLQVGAPQTIAALREAGIRVWVLTGDKQETAIAIGYASELLTSQMTQIIITARSVDACAAAIESAIAEHLGEGRKQLALIVDGNALAFALESALKPNLLKLASACTVVICCRVAPLQKASMVQLVKDGTKAITLAIGDGANDVAMLQTAHVGVGISGQEGRQAVMASDFAIGQFRFLARLLLVHGQWNYYRLAYMVLYNFYKNAVFAIMLFWFVLFTAFSPQSAVNDWDRILYSVVYAALPTIVTGILEQPLTARTLESAPSLYGYSRRGMMYNKKAFWATMADTTWQSLCIGLIPIAVYYKDEVDLWTVGYPMITGIVILVNLHLIMDTQYLTWIHWAAYVISVMIYVVFVLFFCGVSAELPQYWVIYHAAGEPKFWLSLVLILVLGLLPRFAFKALRDRVAPTILTVQREKEILAARIKSQQAALSGDYEDRSLVREVEVSSVLADTHRGNGVMRNV
eukprot:jgi/Chlat1/4474/Chrsp29S04419